MFNVRGEAGDAVCFHHDTLRFSAQADRHAPRGPGRLLDLIAPDHDVASAALDLDSRRLVAAVVDQHVLFDPVAVSGEVGAPFGTEEHPLVGAAADGVAGDEVISVAMADGDADA